MGGDYVADYPFRTSTRGGQWIRIFLDRPFQQGEKGELLVFDKVCVVILPIWCLVSGLDDLGD